MACNCGTTNKNCLCAILAVAHYEQKVQVFENATDTYEFTVTAGTLPADTSKIRVIVSNASNNHMYANPGINFSPIGFTLIEGNKLKIWDNGGVVTFPNFVRIEFFETKTIGDLADCSEITC